MNRQKKAEYNRAAWRLVKISFIICLAFTFMSVDSILDGFGL